MSVSVDAQFEALVMTSPKKDEYPLQPHRIDELDLEKDKSNSNREGLASFQDLRYHQR
jgi:hypothetical protein